MLLLSCYELGRQPFNIASPWAQLEAAGFGVRGIDASIDDVGRESVESARLIAISVPMHTALRLGIELASELRARAPGAHVCFFGMYAALNAEHLLDTVADSVIGGEFEEALVALASALRDAPAGLGGTIPGVVRARSELTGNVAAPVLRKLPFAVPRRDKLPPLGQYATFFGPTEHERRPVGYVEASRGCLHQCRHCPVTAVYRGRFFVVPRDIVLADAAQQIAAGATHLTFGDPDFFNGPGHTMPIVRELARRHPGVSFDVTLKVEHVVRHRELVGELAELGCAFVVSAVESLSDRVLSRLQKGHTRADVFEALALCRRVGLALRPTFVPFTPWTELGDYLELVDWILGEGLVDSLEPIQLAIRLLVPPGSAMLWERDRAPWLGALDPKALGHVWTHPDPRMDRLFEAVSRIVEEHADDEPRATTHAIRAAAYRAAERPLSPLVVPPRRFVPHLSESWFCCAEPTARQLEAIGGGSCEKRTCG